MGVYMETTEKDAKPALFRITARRLHLVLLIMAGFAGTTFMRTNIALAMTCMVNSTALAILEEVGSGILTTTMLPTTNSLLSEVGPNRGKLIKENFTDQCGITLNSQQNGKVVVDYGGSLIWNGDIQNILFSGTFWGALAVILPSMMVINKWSPRIILLSAMLTYSCSTLLLPYAAVHLGYEAVFATRFAMGIGEGVVMPSINAIVANWFPVEERSTAIALFTTGVLLAMVIGNPLAAALCNASVGWPAVFYVSAIYGLVWSLVWFLFSSDTPEECKTMTKKERKYLENSLTSHKGNQHKVGKVPYYAIFTSAPFWAQVAGQFTINFFGTFCQVYVPSYFKEVLYLDVVTNGIFVAIPFVFNSVVNLTYSIFMDRLKGKKIISPTASCKLSQCIGNFGTAGSFILIAFLGDCSRPYLVLGLLCATNMFMGLFVCGFFTSLLSLAPRYTGTLSSISLFMAMIGRLLCPLIVGIFKRTGSIEEWRNIFLFIAAVSIATGILFAIWGSADLQPWGADDVPPPEEREVLQKPHADSAKSNKGRTDSRTIARSFLTGSVMSIDQVM